MSEINPIKYLEINMKKALLIILILSTPLTKARSIADLLFGWGGRTLDFLLDNNHSYLPAHELEIAIRNSNVDAVKKGLSARTTTKADLGWLISIADQIRIDRKGNLLYSLMPCGSIGALSAFLGYRSWNKALSKGTPKAQNPSDSGWTWFRSAWNGTLDSLIAGLDLLIATPPEPKNQAAAEEKKEVIPEAEASLPTTAAEDTSTKSASTGERLRSAVGGAAFFYIGINAAFAIRHLYKRHKDAETIVITLQEVYTKSGAPAKNN